MSRLPAALACVVVLASCAPNAPHIATPVHFEAFCGSKQARLTGVASVMTSTNDAIVPGVQPTGPSVHARLKRDGGVIADWDDQLLALPKTSVILGETDGYARVREVAVPLAPFGAETRPIDLYVRDHGTYRWIEMKAFDVQNVCVEGRREG